MEMYVTFRLNPKGKSTDTEHEIEYMIESDGVEGLTKQ